MVEEINNIVEGLFIPTWDNKPPYRKPILSVNGVGILKFQNISCIIAAPGSGKSSICESIISSVINKDCDSLGFESDIDSILYIDFERAEEDVWTSFHRTMSRAKVKPGETINKANIISLRNVSNAKDRKAKIEQLLRHFKPELLLLDGIGDLVDDTNSLEQSIECKNWVRYITSEFSVSILTTLHPNKNSLTPRGHIGSEILREAEGVLAITVDSNEVRTLTSNFDHGKARNGGHATTCFEWSDEDKMFVSAEVVEKVRIVKLQPHEKLTHEELIDLVKVTNVEPLNATATKEQLKIYIDNKFTHVKKSNKDIYDLFKFLCDNNYLTDIDCGPVKDNRTKFYRVHVNHR